MSYHPDPAVSEALERNARAVTRETVAPPPEMADNPAAYIQWLREQRPQLPPRQSVPKQFTRLYERNRSWVPARRVPVQEEEANPMAWTPTPEETARLDGHGAARYGAGLAAQNDARNAALAGLAAQARPLDRPSVRRVVPAQRPVPKTEQQLEALQQMIDQQQGGEE